MIEQTEAVGHSVRAAYMYTGMADVAALTGDMKYVDAIDAIWGDVATTKLYITGGIGARGRARGLRRPVRAAQPDRLLRDLRLVRQRLLEPPHVPDAGRRQVHGRAGADAVQRGSVRHLDEGRPVLLSERAGVRRPARAKPLVRLRLLPVERGAVHPVCAGLHLCLQGQRPLRESLHRRRRNVRTAGNSVKLSQQTEYPWKGQVAITVEPEKSDTFAIFVRIPGWARNEPVPSDLYKFADASVETQDVASLRVNGKTVSFAVEKGFARIDAHGKRATKSCWTCRCRFAGSSRIPRSRPTRARSPSSAGRSSSVSKAPTTTARC